MRLDSEARIKHSVQSYEVMDQIRWQGTMAIVKMFLPLLHRRSQLKSHMIVNPKKNDELKFTENLSDFDDSELEVAYDFTTKQQQTQLKPETALLIESQEPPEPAYPNQGQNSDDDSDQFKLPHDETGQILIIDQRKSVQVSVEPIILPLTPEKRYSKVDKLPPIELKKMSLPEINEVDIYSPE